MPYVAQSLLHLTVWGNKREQKVPTLLCCSQSRTPRLEIHLKTNILLGFSLNTLIKWVLSFCGGLCFVVSGTSRSRSLSSVSLHFLVYFLASRSLILPFSSSRYLLAHFRTHWQALSPFMSDVTPPPQPHFPHPASNHLLQVCAKQTFHSQLSAIY